MNERIAILPSVEAFLAREQHLLIGGEWVAAADGQTFPTVNPATGTPLTYCAKGGAEDINRAVAAARAAFPNWSAMMPAQRERLLMRFAELMETHKAELAQLEVLDNGKPWNSAYNVEVNVAIGQMRYYAGWPTKLTGETYAVSSPGFHVYTRREALGVCGAITPWNYSLVMATQKIGPALAAGNTLVLKPAEQTPLTAIRLAELALEAGIPAGVFNVVTGFGETGAALTHHPDVDKVAFTGSTEVGKLILQASAGNLKHVSLELGGKSPLIIMDDADLVTATETALWAIFANSGQNCVAGSRLFVQAGVHDSVVESLTTKASQLRVGSGLDTRNHLGPLISLAQMERVLGYIQTGTQEGNQLVQGGSRLVGGDLAGGYFVEPTIFSEVTDTRVIASEEIFGPVLSVLRFEDEAEVIQRANATRYGLAAGVWTNNLSRAHRMAAALKAGVVWINTYDWFDPAVPFGGMGESGSGRELGRQVMEQYTELKSVWVKL
jgi:acyl-CoA reductase-like NAD-dependent aldehyde dehydrogenase